MNRPAIALCALLTAACGASATTTDTTTTTTGLPERCDGACNEGDRCMNGVDWQCTCTHYPDVNCGGAQRLLGPGTWSWACVPTVSPPPAPTDCPATVPADGSACPAATECSYPGACNWSGTNASCDGSVWHVQMWMTSPPP